MIKRLKLNRLQKYKRCPVVVVGARLPCVEFKNNKWNNRIIFFVKNNSKK